MPGDGRSPGTQMKFSGECNRCGLCCLSTGRDGEALRCKNLVVRTIVGKPDATRCAVYDRRFDGMEIEMLDAAGNLKSIAICAKGSAEEDLVIFEHGIGRGCSLTIEEVPLMTFIRKGQARG